MTEGHFYLAKVHIGIAKCAHSREKSKDFFLGAICVFPRARAHFRICISGKSRIAFSLARGTTSGFQGRSHLDAVRILQSQEAGPEGDQKNRRIAITFLRVF